MLLEWRIKTVKNGGKPSYTPCTKEQGEREIEKNKKIIKERALNIVQTLVSPDEYDTILNAIPQSCPYCGANENQPHKSNCDIYED